MARFSIANQAELDSIKKAEAVLEKKLSALRKRSHLLAYAKMKNVDPETYLARTRAPLLEMKVKYDKAVELLNTNGFKLVKSRLRNQAPQFEDPTVWRMRDFFGEQAFTKKVNGVTITYVFDVPMGNSSIRDEDYLAVSTWTTLPKSKDKHFEALLKAEIKCGGNAYFLKTFKAFERQFTNLIAVVESF